MLGHLLRRFGALLGVLAAVISVTFILLRLAPGDPFIAEKAITPQALEQKKRDLQLDGSVVSQLARYYRDVLTGDLRVSTKYKNTRVSEILGQSLPVSFHLGGVAFVLSAIGGVVLGVTAAMKRGTWADFVSMLAALAAISLPAFVIGPLLIWIFSLKLGLFPIGGWFQWKATVLPAVCLALPYVAYVARLMRNSLLEVLAQDFVRTARAKGLSALRVTYRHAVRVAILPVVTFLGPLAANLLTGSVIVESIFGIPGAGQYFVRAIENRDFFLLLGVVMVYCTLLVALNFVVDVAYTWLDRRIKLGPAA